MGGCGRSGSLGEVFFWLRRCWRGMGALFGALGALLAETAESGSWLGCSVGLG